MKEIDLNGAIARIAACEKGREGSNFFQRLKIVLFGEEKPKGFNLEAKHKNLNLAQK